MSAHGERRFHEAFPTPFKDECSVKERTQALFKFINGNIVGKDLTFVGPYGPRKVVYCDYTASGRSLKFIEDFIGKQVLPHYANTHNTVSVTSLQTTMLRYEARDIIRNYLNANESDAVIFTGSGATSAVKKLIHCLDIKIPPVVFLGPFEHHSNILTWKEIGSKIVWILEDENGNVDIHDLNTKLKKHKTSGRPLIGCFSAASNVTGIVVDTIAIATCLHQHDALAFFDYAAAGPYVSVDMNPPTSTLGYKDAVFISVHKMIGGPATPGILVAKKKLFKNHTPSIPGGGTVFFVTESSHRYLKEIEEREEGGTPQIIQSIRAGIVFHLKKMIGVTNIVERDAELVSKAFKRWENCKNLIVLGSQQTQRLPIFSFVIRHAASGRLLHHNYVSALLDDLFGIQSRGGCACAGPYAQRLLGMSEEIALKIEHLLLEDGRLDRKHLRRQKEYSQREVLRPGFTRINLPYFFSEEEVDFVLEAVAMVAEHGWKLLPMYMFNPESGEWKHKQHQVFKGRKWIGQLRYVEGEIRDMENEPPPASNQTLNQTLEMVLEILSQNKKERCADQTLLLGEEGEPLRWYLLPCEANDYLQDKTPALSKMPMPFFPGRKVPPPHDQVENTTNLHYCTCSSLNNFDAKQENGVVEQNNKTDNIDYASEKLQEVNVNDSTAKDTLIENSTDKTLDSASSLYNNHLSLDNNIDASIVKKKYEGSPVNDKSMLCLLPRSKSKANEQEINPLEMNKKATFHNPPKFIFSKVIEAMDEFGMIKDKDRVLLCLSGGKDSLSMLHIIQQYRYVARKKGINFEFGAVTVDPQSAGYDPSPLKAYLKSLDVPYFYESQDIIGAAMDLSVCESICSFCSRMKRGRIYACARREKYNVIALGQHLDDAAESFLMSTFHNGYLRTIKAHYTISEKDIRVIRPLIYVREKDLREFSEKVYMPVIQENCPACFDAPKERHRMKQLLAQQEILFPNLFKSLRASLNPLLSKNATGQEKRKDDEDEL